MHYFYRARTRTVTLTDAATRKLACIRGACSLPVQHELSLEHNTGIERPNYNRVVQCPVSVIELFALDQQGIHSQVAAASLIHGDYNLVR